MLFTLGTASKTAVKNRQWLFLLDSCFSSLKTWVRPTNCVGEDGTFMVGPPRVPHGM